MNPDIHYVLTRCVVSGIGFEFVVILVVNSEQLNLIRSSLAPPPLIADKIAQKAIAPLAKVAPIIKLVGPEVSMFFFWKGQEVERELLSLIASFPAKLVEEVKIDISNM